MVLRQQARAGREDEQEKAEAALRARPGPEGTGTRQSSALKEVNALQIGRR